eukprot:g7029.t1
MAFPARHRAACTWLLLAMAAAEPKPVYPRQMSYKCTMKVKPGIKDIFAGNNFTGTHYLNADLKLMRTEWKMTCPHGSCGQFGPSPTSVGINAHGEEQAMYQTFANERLPPGPGGALAVQCQKLPLHSPVFNETWADDAVYRGVHYLDGRLCHRWSNTVPWAIQRVQRTGGETAQESEVWDLFVSCKGQSIGYQWHTYSLSGQSSRYLLGTKSHRWVQVATQTIPTDITTGVTGVCLEDL